MKLLSETKFFSLYIFFASMLQQLSIYRLSFIYWDYTHLIMLSIILFADYTVNTLEKPNSMIIREDNQKPQLSANRNKTNETFFSKDWTILFLLILCVLISRKDVIISDLARCLIVIGWYSNCIVSDNSQSKKKSTKYMHILSPDLNIPSNLSIVISTAIKSGKLGLFITFISQIVPIVCSQPKELLFDRKICVINAFFSFCYIFLFLWMRLIHKEVFSTSRKIGDLSSVTVFCKINKNISASSSIYWYIYQIEKDLLECLILKESLLFEAILSLLYFLVSFQSLVALSLSQQIYCPVIIAAFNLTIIEITQR